MQCLVWDKQDVSEIMSRMIDMLKGGDHHHAALAFCEVVLGAAAGHWRVE